ncbi:hypothetical protein LZ30DRAFT_331814 [Colletotrichum cereale]|nr:hypothetical protein LZ30DRAFT_331814 [Colletotrichum cereale]
MRPSALKELHRNALPGSSRRCFPSFLFSPYTNNSSLKPFYPGVPFPSGRRRRLIMRREDAQTRSSPTSLLQFYLRHTRIFSLHLLVVVLHFETLRDVSVFAETGKVPDLSIYFSNGFSVTTQDLHESEAHPQAQVLHVNHTGICGYSSKVVKEFPNEPAHYGQDRRKFIDGFSYY